MLKKLNNFKNFFKKNNFLICFLNVITLSFIELLIYSIISDYNNNLPLTYVLTYLISLLIFYFLFDNELVSDFKDLKKVFKEHAKNLIIAFITLTTITLLTNTIITKFATVLPANELLTRTTLKAYPISMGITIILLAPIIEEIIYRLPFRYIKNHRFLTYIIYSSIFALIHITSLKTPLELLYIIPYFFQSLTFGYGLYKTNNIFVSIIMHIIYNSLNFMLLFIM